MSEWELRVSQREIHRMHVVMEGRSGSDQGRFGLRPIDWRENLRI